MKKHLARLSASLCVFSYAGLSAYAADEVKGFPADVGMKTTIKAISAEDLDGDKKFDVFTLTQTGLVHVDGKGTVYELAMLPEQETVTTARQPVYCDVDRDGRKEVIIAINSTLHALEADGAAVGGWPLNMSGTAKGSLACGPEGVYGVTDAGDVFVAQKGIKKLDRIGAGAESGVSLADLDRDGKLDIAAVGGDSQLYVLKSSKKFKKERLYKMSFRVSGSVAIGDVDDDGEADFVIGSQDFGIHVVNQKGESLKGFPVKTKYRIYGSPALADFDGDGVLDIIIGSGDRKLYGLKGTGKNLPGFPVALNGPVETDVVVSDVDRDGKFEIGVVTKSGSLYVLNQRGKPLPGFPVSIGKDSPGPLFADLDGDGRNELMAQEKMGRLRAYTFPKKGDEDTDTGWPQPGHDPQGTSRYWPNQGRFLELSFEDKEPKTTDAVKASYRFIDLDGDKESGTKVRWYLDGKLQSQFNDKAAVPADQTKKGQTWKYTLQSGDNFKRHGDSGKLTQIFTSPEVRILNTPPVAPKVALSPGTPTTTDGLKATVTQASTDVDGDAISYTYIWLRDNLAAAGVSPTSGELPAHKTKKGERWLVYVVPNDGESPGEPGSAQVEIVNTKPGAPTVRAAAETAPVTEVVPIKMSAPAPDADKDELEYRYYYAVDGKSVAVPPSLSALPLGLVRKGQSVKVRVEAHDGEVAGGVAEAGYRVVNTPPPVPKVRIEPAKPRTGDDITAAVIGQPADADGDSIAYKIQWTKNGTAVTEGWRIPAEKTKRGEVWSVSVVASDGEVDSAPVSAKVTVLNTKPEPPRVSWVKPTPFTTDELKVAVDAAATDADADEIVLKYRWKKNGKPVKGLSNSTVEASATKKKQTWEVEVVAFDGQVESDAVRLVTAVLNTPPTLPAIKVSNPAPRVTDQVLVSLTTPSSDADGDKLSYRYRWLKDGVPQKAWSSDKNGLAQKDMKKGESWEVQVRAFDGDEEGGMVTASLAIQNSVPSAPSIQVLPAAPKTGDELDCKIAKEGQDADQDRLSYDIAWFLNGKKYGADPSTGKASPELTREGQRWHCEARSFDGTAYSALAKAKPTTVGNTPPPTPAVAVYPAKPKTHQNLICGVSSQEADADADPLSYSFTWTVDGKSAPAKGPQVDAKNTKRGQKWACRVTAKDEKAASDPSSAEVRIGNTAPTKPRAEFSVAKPKPGEALVCEVKEASTDIDGDKIQYSYVWKRNGQAQSFASSSSEVPARLVRAGDGWVCEVTPSDGTDKGPMASTKMVTIEGERVIRRQSLRKRRRR